MSMSIGGTNPNIIQCFRGLVLITPTAGIGATNATLIPVTGPMRGQPIHLSQAISPAAGPISLQDVDGEVTMVCGTLTRGTGGMLTLLITSVFPVS